MKRFKSKLYIGTSGWAYGDWQGIFYPEDLPPRDKLRYFSKHFKTAEINYSFYHLPRPATYQKWYSETPADFVFSVKASRFITHIKRLNGVKEAWKQFLENALSLKEKLGPILFQFPPSFKATPENTERLEKFLKEVLKEVSLKSQIRRIKAMAIIRRMAMEFRDKSWCSEKIYKLLKKYNIAWVIADSPCYPTLRRGSGQEAEAITANFVYIRMHGSRILFASKYTKKELIFLSSKIKKWLKRNLDVYCYFNNDFQGYAAEDAKELLGLLD